MIVRRRRSHARAFVNDHSIDEQTTFAPTDVLETQTEDFATPQTGEQHRVDHRPVPGLAKRRDELDDVVVMEDLREMPDRAAVATPPDLPERRADRSGRPCRLSAGPAALGRPGAVDLPGSLRRRCVDSQHRDGAVGSMLHEARAERSILAARRSDVEPPTGDDLYGWSVAEDAEFTYLYSHCYQQFGYDTLLGLARAPRTSSSHGCPGDTPSAASRSPRATS